MMISVEAYSEIVEVLYATAVRPELWGRFLNLLCVHTGSRNSFLICADRRSDLSIQFQGGKPYDMKLVADYAKRYAPQDPYRIPMLRCGKTGVLDPEALVPTEVLLQTEMFQNVIVPTGARYPAVVLLTCTLRRLEVVSFWRTVEEGPMPMEGNRLMALLVPHIQAALEIRQVLGVARQRMVGAEAMADASPTATFLLGERGELMHCNAAAKALLQQGDSLVVEQGLLVAAANRMRKPLSTLLQRVVSPIKSVATYRSSGVALLLERVSGKHPLHALASRILQVAGPGGILLLVTDQDRAARMAEDTLQEYYSLTRAETEVAQGLLTGYSLADIAILRKVSVGTVRQQLKVIFGKTRTNRQAELVRLMFSLPSVA